MSIFSGKEAQKIDEVKMVEDEVCVSMCFCATKQEGVEMSFILLGCVKNLKYHPTFSLSSPSIKVYEWMAQEGKAKLYHETEVEDIPLVLHTWK